MRRILASFVLIGLVTSCGGNSNSRLRRTDAAVDASAPDDDVDFEGSLDGGEPEPEPEPEPEAPDASAPPEDAGSPDPNRDAGPLDAAVVDSPDTSVEMQGCGNGVVEGNETCDPPDSCPTECASGSACLRVELIGDPAACTAECVEEVIETCASGDGCCPAGCNAELDDDCSASCGNGTVEPGETCDPPEDCPSECDDGNACTADLLMGSMENCSAACVAQAVTACEDDDQCCPAGCDGTTDNDCSASCGNGAVEPGETCDPAEDCPSGCDDGNACTVDLLTGSADNCNAQCSFTAITSCIDADGCCPSGCDVETDDDCSASCGDGVVEGNEVCDPPSLCPSSCDDGNACTIGTLTGSADNCNAQCSFTTITQCTDGDGCCPPACDATTDDDCSASCGNGTIEPGETCDPPGSCVSSCVDNNACTNDIFTGSPNNCNASCVFSAITQCVHNDGCCPAACNQVLDADCSASCGNGVLEPGETCDPPGSCVDTCDDGNACTFDLMTGSPNNCNVLCSNNPITQCSDGDGCCPTGCDNTSDDDCAAECGNDVIEDGETCDPPSSCPPSCDDGDSCTQNILSGSADACTAECSFPPITSCMDTDGCCPTGCNANTDDDCEPSCGNDVVEDGETCDPPASCETDCDSGDACKPGTLVGVPEECTAECVFDEITACQSGDGCCPADCSPNNDEDCVTPPECGNDVIEEGETCDPPASCPRSCNDQNTCTKDSLIGSPDLCTAECVFDPITDCGSDDGCCPDGCTAREDRDCGTQQLTWTGETNQGFPFQIVTSGNAVVRFIYEAKTGCGQIVRTVNIAPPVELDNGDFTYSPSPNQCPIEAITGSLSFDTGEGGGQFALLFLEGDQCGCQGNEVYSWSVELP